MTYGILSLASGNVIESYATHEGVIEAAARILRSEPLALGSFAVLEFDGREIIGSLEGEELREQVAPLLAAHGDAAIH